MDFNALANNKLFLQYLTGAGADIAAGNPIGANVNAVTNQNIAAQNKFKLQENYIKKLKKMLEGDFGDGDSLTMKADGMSFKSGTSLVKKSGMEPNTATAGENPNVYGEGNDWIVDPATGQRKQRNPFTEETNVPTGYTDVRRINPFGEGQPSMSGADLAGLTPQDISQALTGAQGVVGMPSDIAYKQALTGQATASGMKAVSEIGEIDRLSRPYPILGPGGTQMTAGEWTALPADQKDYLAYLHVAKQLGDADIMSKEEFDAMEPTERQKFLDYLMKNPEAMKAQKELAKAGSSTFNLGEIKARAETTDLVDRQSEVLSAGYQAKIEKYIQEKSSTAWNASAEIDESLKASNPELFGKRDKILDQKKYDQLKKEKRKEHQYKMTIKEMDNRIKTVYPGAKRQPDGWYKADGSFIRGYPEW